VGHKFKTIDRNEECGHQVEVANIKDKAILGINLKEDNEVMLDIQLDVLNDRNIEYRNWPQAPRKVIRGKISCGLRKL
jgi:hypothetical protein